MASSSATHVVVGPSSWWNPYGEKNGKNHGWCRNELLPDVAAESEKKLGAVSGGDGLAGAAPAEVGKGERNGKIIRVRFDHHHH